MASKSHNQMNEIWRSIAAQIEINEQTETTVRTDINQNHQENREEKQSINDKNDGGSFPYNFRKTYNSSIAAYHQTIKTHSTWLETNIQTSKFI